MAITTMDLLVAGLAAGFRAPFYKGSTTAGTTNQWASFWTVAGVPGAGATPTSGAGDVPTRTTAGALYFTNPSSGNSYLAAVHMGVGSNITIPALYDRLVETSGLSGTVTTAQTVNSTAITRPDANGAGTELFLELYANTGATATTATVSYTNQAGTSGQSGTATLPTNMKATQLVPVSLAAGDTGVRSVQSVTLAASTGTAGNFGITIARRLAEPSVPGGAGAMASLDAFLLGLPQIYNDACLWVVGYGTGTAIGPVTGLAVVAQG